MKNRKHLVLMLMAIVVIVSSTGCTIAYDQSETTIPPTFIPELTDASETTNTRDHGNASKPTNTPEFTTTPEPTNTPEPTSTPKPTNTPEPTSTQRSLWSISSSIDEMTEETSYFAISENIFSTKPMDFPYEDVEAWIGVGCSGPSEWAFIGFSSAPNLENTEIEDGYNRINTRVKWDDLIEQITLYQDWGDKFLTAPFDKNIIENLASHDTLLLELEWYGQGNVYFRFPLTGAKDSIESIRANCVP